MSLSTEFQADYLRSVEQGIDVGWGGLLGAQERRRREGMEALRFQRQMLLSRKEVSPLPTSKSWQNVPTGRAFPKFVSYLSYRFIFVGLGVGLWLSFGLSGWWPLVGTLAGGAVGFATPALTYLLVMLIAYLALSLLLAVLELLWFLFKAACVAALVIGAWYVIFYVFV